jgi:thiol-disulfide isomerase/thioredoxin
MRKLLLISLLFPLFFACGDKSSYKITGQIASNSLDEKTLYLRDIVSGQALDSAIVKNQKFDFKGKTDTSYLVVLTDNVNMQTLVFVESGNINVNIDINAADKNVVKGTKLNDLHLTYINETASVHAKLVEMNQYYRSQPYTPELGEEYNEKQKVLMEELSAHSIQFIDQNPGTILTALILANAISYGADADVAKNAYDKLDEQVKNTAVGKYLQQEVEYLQIEVEKKSISEIAVGEPFRDLQLKTPDDKDISISDYAGKGKYVLLDFWASWCSPCRIENPNVVALYNEYKDKGFEIVGLSFDQDKEAWIKGIKDDGITWPQMSDIKGWSSIAALKYKVQGIPYTVLLDKEGKVIEVNLRGEALKDKLKTLIP